MGKPIINYGIKWIEQIPKHIKLLLDSQDKDYSLNDVIIICEEIIALYDDGENTKTTWNGIAVLNLMMSTVSFRNKFKRYLK